MTTDATLEEMLKAHRAAVAEFEARASGVSVDRWLTPRAEGKWTPAEETRHLILTYQAFTANLRGERTMRLKGSPLLRRVWRLFGLTWILWRGRIPRAVRAPREVRPEGETGERDALLAAFEAEVAGFEAAYTACWHSRPGATVTHPFFGELNLRHALHLAGVHTRHHAAFLPPAGTV